MKILCLLLFIVTVSGGAPVNEAREEDSFLYENLIELSSSNILAARKAGDKQREMVFQKRYCLMVFVFWMNHVDGKKTTGEIARISNVVQKTFTAFATHGTSIDPFNIKDVFSDERFRHDSILKILKMRYGNIPVSAESVADEESYKKVVIRFREWLAPKPQ